MKAKRLLIMTSEFPPQPGGIGNQAYHLAKQLQIHGVQVEVICDNRSFDGCLEKAFDSPLKFKVHRIANRRFRTGMYVTRLQLLFRAIKHVDVVMASGKFSLWAVGFSTWFYKKKYVAVLHGTEVNFKSFALRTSIDYALQRFHKVICVSNYTKSLIDRLHLEHVEVIPNGLEISKWSNVTLEPVVLEGHPKLVTVGHVTERKGQGNVIKQLPELVRVFPQLHYHCIGIPTEKEVFLNLAKDLKVEGHVTFHGQVDDSQLQSLLVSCDVFVMLSGTTATGDVEGFGIAILEANALGLPAIGALGCGIEDAIDPNRSGMLIARDDTPSFIKAINTILEHKDELATHAKKWAIQHDWKLVVERYLEVIE